MVSCGLVERLEAARDIRPLRIANCQTTVWLDAAPYSHSGPPDTCCIPDDGDGVGEEAFYYFDDPTGVPFVLLHSF